MGMDILCIQNGIWMDAGEYGWVRFTWMLVHLTSELGVSHESLFCYSLH